MWLESLNIKNNVFCPRKLEFLMILEIFTVGLMWSRVVLLKKIHGFKHFILVSFRNVEQFFLRWYESLKLHVHLFILIFLLSLMTTGTLSRF